MTDLRFKEKASLEGVTMDLLMCGNTLDETEELATAVRIALGTDALADDDDVLPDPDSIDRKGWWGDIDAAEVWDGWAVGSKNWLLTRAKITSAEAYEGDTLENARLYSLAALQPFIDKKIVSRIDVSVERTDLERIDVLVTIYRGPQQEIDLRYAIMWDELR